MAEMMSITEIMECKLETPLFLETKQTCRPAFFMGFVDMGQIFKDRRFAVRLMTSAKLLKCWEMRNYNKTWRLWMGRPTRQQRMDGKWAIWP